MSGEVKKVYWKRGYHNTIKAEVAYRALEQIKAKNGGTLTPGIVVIEARNVRSPLHKEVFRVDVETAAEEWYMTQARKLIGSVEVIYEETPHIPPTRYYVPITEEKKGEQPERKVFKTTTEALEDPILRDEILGNAIRDAITYRRKYSALSELAEVFVAIDEVIEKTKIA